MLKSIARFLGSPVSMFVGGRNEGFKYGLELELEGQGVGLEGVPVKGWSRHHDQSLRGESIEFVFNGPCEYDESVKRVDALFKKFEAKGVRINNSHRTSTHVHLNFSDKTVKDVVTFFCLYTMLERLLEPMCGEDRIGNLFCLSSRHSENIIDVVHHGIAKSTFDAFRRDAFKYAACNLSTLFKFGTVEIRSMRGADDAKMVTRWLQVLKAMYEYACKPEVMPCNLIGELSMEGGMVFLRKVFPIEAFAYIMAHNVGKDVHRELLSGARLIQGIAYDFSEEFEQFANQAGEMGGRVLGPHARVIKSNGESWSIEGGLGDGDVVIDDRSVFWCARLVSYCQVKVDGTIVPLQYHGEPPADALKFGFAARERSRKLIFVRNAADEWDRYFVINYEDSVELAFRAMKAKHEDYLRLLQIGDLDDDDDEDFDDED